MTAVPQTKMTLEEYLEFDRNAEGRFEYFDGEIFEVILKMLTDLTVKIIEEQAVIDVSPANNIFTVLYYFSYF